MAYILILIAMIFIFISLHRFTTQSMRNKIGITFILFVVLVLLSIYEQSNDKSREKMHQLTFAFDHNKTLECDGLMVHKEFFNYSARSFIGKKNTPQFGQMIPLGSCQIK